MCKKFLFAAALLLSAALAVAQSDLKIAYVSYEEILFAMPEISDAESALATLNESYKAELGKMQDELNRKYSDYLAEKDSLPENIILRREQELAELQERTQNFYMVSNQEMQKKQQELLAPIRQKLDDMIKKIAAESGYTYVFNQEDLLYVGPNGIDISSQVKKALGL